MVAERRSDATRLARRIADVLVPPIMEEIVKVVKVVFQEQIAERICEQIADVDGSQVAEQDTEVSKTSNRDRTLQRAVEQIFDVPVPEMVNQLVEEPKTVLQERIRQRTVEQIVDAPVPQTVEEQAEVFRGFSQDRIQQRAVEQIIENPANSVAEMIVEVPVIQTPERTQQVVNTHVQHVVNAVEAEKPKIIELTVQKKRPIIQEKMNQMTKPVKIPQVQFLTLDKVVDMPGVVQRQVSTDQTVQKTVEVPPLRLTDKVSDIPVVAQRQIPVMVQTVQKTMEIPHLQCVDNVSDVPVVSVVPAPQVQVSEKTVEISQLQAAEKIVETRGTQTSEKLGTALVCQSTQAEIVEAVEIGALFPAESAVLVPVAVPKTFNSPRVQLIDRVVDIPVMAQRHVPSAPGVQKIVEMSKGQFSDGHVDMPVVAQRQVPMIPNVQKTVEVPQIQYIDKIEDAPVVARSEDVSVGTQKDEEREASLPDALADRTKVVKLVVDKWFVDRGFGFGKVPTGEIVFIHASAVVGAEVLTIGTDAWVQVVNDDARAQGGYRARRAWGQDVWQAEKNKEKANKVAQQVRRAAALTAELAAQSEKKTAAVCDQPPGLDELAGHIEAPNMGAGGSHPQATMMPDPWATFKSPSASQATVISPLPASQSFSNFSGKSRKGRSRSSTRAQDNVAMLEETMRLVVEATGKDEASARQQLVNKRPAELLRARDFWRTRVEEKQRFQVKKKEAWEFFRRVPSFRPNKQEHFEEEFKQKVMTGYSSGSPEGRERYLDEWTAELQKKALEVDRRLEAKERVKMGEEDAGSKRRTEWERIFERSPFLIAAS